MPGERIIPQSSIATLARGFELTGLKMLSGVAVLDDQRGVAPGAVDAPLLKLAVGWLVKLQKLPVMLAVSPEPVVGHHMIVLGIDAAWTRDKPSGTALLHFEPDSKPNVIAVSRSFDEFLSIVPGSPLPWDSKISVGQPRLGNLLAYASEIAGQPVDLVAIDMPLSPSPITSRRNADNAVSAVYGGRGAAVHSPSAERPGPIADQWFTDLAKFGYRWLHSPTEALTFPAFIEVYPHIAIIEMLGLNYRLAYKVEKRSAYFPDLPSGERLAAVLENVSRLRSGLVDRIEGLEVLIPPPSDLASLGTSSLKGYEDVLDALVSAWMGCEVIAGRAVAYGDETCAIWGPSPQSLPIG